MKKRFASLMTTLILSVFFAVSASAYDVEVDGIYYNYIAEGKAVEVTYGDIKQSGDVVIPSTITVDGKDYDVVGIGNYAFSGNENVTSVSIPKTITTIGQDAFSNCNPTSVYINDLEAWCNINFVSQYSNPIYGQSVDCGNLFLNGELVTDLVIPSTITKINDYAFNRCDCIESLTIPNSVTSIGRWAFWACENLKSVNLPNSIRSIEEAAFAACYNLTSVIIPNSVTSISSYAFAHLRNLSSLTISSSLSTIKENTFMNLTSLKTLIIPGSVNTIYREAFEGCSELKSVVFENNNYYLYMYENVFKNCRKIETVTCYSTNPPTTREDIFNGVYINYATLIVPQTALDKYKNTYPWNKFGTIKTIEGTERNKCSTPIIKYEKGKLTYTCETEGAEYVSNISSNDINTFYTDKVALSACYNISVTAKKDGYDNSDVATAKLYWLPSSGTLETDNINTAAMRGIAIQTAGGFINISGLDNNERVDFFGVDGKSLGSAKSIDGCVTFATKSETVVIAKIGNERVKIKVN